MKNILIDYELLGFSLEQLILEVCVKVKIRFPLNLFYLPAVFMFLILLTYSPHSKQFTHSVYAQYLK